VDERVRPGMLSRTDEQHPGLRRRGFATVHYSGTGAKRLPHKTPELVRISAVLAEKSGIRETLFPRRRVVAGTEIGLEPALGKEVPAAGPLSRLGSAQSLNRNHSPQPCRLAQGDLRAHMDSLTASSSAPGDRPLFGGHQVQLWRGGGRIPRPGRRRSRSAVAAALCESSSLADRLRTCEVCLPASIKGYVSDGTPIIVCASDDSRGAATLPAQRFRSQPDGRQPSGYNAKPFSGSGAVAARTRGVAHFHNRRGLARS